MQSYIYASPSQSPFCLSQYRYGKTSVKENLHPNEGANSQMFTQKVHFNYNKNLRIRTWIFQLA